jgi:cytochrome b
MASGPDASGRVAIWDWPVRICHWLFVLLIPLAWWTAEEHMFDWHLRIGIALLLLLVFRLIWGLVGSSTARFATFLRGPHDALAYVRGRPTGRIGHNPLGGWSVVALLAAMLLQLGLGLFATDDDGLDSGPLNHLVDYDTAERITDLHEANFNILLALIGLHVAAILFYAIVKRDDLVRPMVTGRGKAPAGAEPMRPASMIRFAIAAGVAFAFTWWVFEGAPPLGG